jgi:hypothetical protein
MTESSERVVLVVNGRVHEIPAHRSPGGPGPRDAADWWVALIVLGGALVVLGGFVGFNLGPEAAVGGVALFVFTAIVAGVERNELATALGAAGVVWTSAGISVTLGADPWLLGSALGFAIVGVAVVAGGEIGVRRARASGAHPAS